MDPRKRLRLGEMLVDAGLITEDQLRQALAAGKPGALELWKTGANCKACHEAHKPD